MSKNTPSRKKTESIRGYFQSGRTKNLRSGAKMAAEEGTEDMPKGLEAWFERLSTNLNKKFDESRITLLETMNNKFDESNLSLVGSVEKKLDEHSEKFDSKIDIKFIEVQDTIGKIRENITQIEININAVTRTQNSQKARQDEYDSKFNALEIKYLKLDQSMKELSKKDEVTEAALAFANSEIETLKKNAANQRQASEMDRSRIDKVETRCNDQEFKDEIKEQHSRKMNLWIYGVNQADEDEDVWVTVCEFGKKVLKLENEFLDELMVKNAHRVGKDKSPDRPIIVAFLMAKDRMRFLKAASTLYQYNKENKTKYGVKTDLAPKARAKRTRYNIAAYNWRKATGKILMVRSNDSGKVWMVTKPNHESPWKPVDYIDPKWFLVQQDPPSNKE